jgi:hypothetical protein
MGAEGIAKGMVEQLAKEGFLCQETAVFEIAVNLAGNLRTKTRMAIPPSGETCSPPFISSPATLWSGTRRTDAGECARRTMGRAHGSTKVTGLSVQKRTVSVAEKAFPAIRINHGTSVAGVLLFQSSD